MGEALVLSGINNHLTDGSGLFRKTPAGGVIIQSRTSVSSFEPVPIFTPVMWERRTSTGWEIEHHGNVMDDDKIIILWSEDIGVEDSFDSVLFPENGTKWKGIDDLSRKDKLRLKRLGVWNTNWGKEPK